MQFLWDFVSDETSFTPVATNLTKCHVEIQHGIFNDLYISRNTAFNYTMTIPTEWDSNTLLHALFNGDLKAGNVDFTINEIDAIRIKHRPSNTFNWLTIAEYPIHSLDDLNITTYDKLCQSNQDYDWCLVPVANGIEGNMYIASARSEFDGMFIIGQDKMVGSELNYSWITQHNKPVAVYNPLGSKYAKTISTNSNNYDSGSISATYFEPDLPRHTWKVDEGVTFRMWVMQFLCDGRPKLIKDFQGRMWLCSITGNVVDDYSQHYNMPITRFDFVEIADAKNGYDLFNSGILNVNYPYEEG